MSANNLQQAELLTSEDNKTGPAPVYLSLEEHTASYCKQWDVYFDGTRQRHCVRADVKYGYIVRLVTTKFGVPIKGSTGKWATEKLFGRVEILPAGTDYAIWRKSNGSDTQR